MTGETDLQKILQTLEPKLNEGFYVFCTIKDHNKIDGEFIFTFKEEEGLTVVLKKENADKINLKYESEYSWITLTVHSSLDAVGLTASFSKALANNNISCNVVSGYYHDHIFINKNKTTEAMLILKNINKYL